LTERRTAVVAGGGLAGITAACALADAGWRVTLIEKRPFLGGRSYSYTDKATGTEVDNGQHVFLGCCTAYISLLERLAIRDRAHLQKRLRVPVIDKVWGTSVLTAADLPPPLHLLPSLLRFKSLSPGEKVAAGWAFSAIQALDRTRHPELDDITFKDWLLSKRQSRHSIDNFWNLIVQPTLNDHVSRVSADLALMVFQEGFLRSRSGANVGWSRVGLTSLVGEAATRYITDRGGEVRLSESIRGVEVDAGTVSGLWTESGEVKADSYVVALSPEQTFEALPGVLTGDPFFSRIARLESSPIVNVHLWFDRPVWDRKFAAFLNTPVQWVFNKSAIWRREEPGQYLNIVLSGARDFIGLPNAEIVALFTKEMWSLLPATRGAAITRALVVKQRDATFAAGPGTRRLRPPQATPVRNLSLAGDWTETGWPATMESAVRSGVMAAQVASRPAEGSERQVVAV